MFSDHARKIPIFWGHGTHDPLVTFEMATTSTNFLTQKAGIKTATPEDPTGLEFHAYEGLVHSADPEELKDLSNWLKRVIPKTE